MVIPDHTHLVFLDRDQGQRSVGNDLRLNYLQRFSRRQKSLLARGYYQELLLLTLALSGNIPSPFVLLSPNPNAGIVSLSLNCSNVSPQIQIT